MLQARFTFIMSLSNSTFHICISPLTENRKESGHTASYKIAPAVHMTKYLAHINLIFRKFKIKLKYIIIIKWNPVVNGDITPSYNGMYRYII